LIYIVNIIIKPITFKWDENKNNLNQKKHGISFSEAESVFYDDNARLIFDTHHSKTEDRFVLMGISSSLRILIVIHIYKKNDEIIRIISARKATKSEMKQYKETLR
jgi:uncharacterized DUF497 family protein